MTKKTEKVENKKPLLDIFETLSAIDKKNLNFYFNLTKEQQKGFLPFIVIRWASSIYSSNNNIKNHYITEVNNRVNIGFWELSKHPELQYKLLASVGNGKIQKHSWIKGPKRNISTNIIDELIINLHPEFNDLEVKIIKNKLNKENLKSLCKDLGMDDSKIKKYLSELKKENENDGKK